MAERSSWTRLSDVTVTWTLLTAAVCRSRKGDIRSISILILITLQTTTTTIIIIIIIIIFLLRSR